MSRPSAKAALSSIPTLSAARKKAAARSPAAEADALDRYDFQQDSLGYALRRAQVFAYDLFFEMIGELGLSPARLTALSLIAVESEMNQATLARRLDVSGPSVMKLIDALETAGLIRRMDVEGDRRRYSLVLTPAGRKLLETLRVRMEAYEQRLAAGLSASERKVLMGLLGKVVG